MKEKETGEASEEPARLMHITINRREEQDALNRKSRTETEASGGEGRKKKKRLILIYQPGSL